MTALLRLWIEVEYRFLSRGNSRAASEATPSSQLSTPGRDPSDRAVEAADGQVKDRGFMRLNHRTTAVFRAFLISGSS
jgi:hypothetical protein